MAAATSFPIEPALIIPANTRANVRVSVTLASSTSTATPAGTPFGGPLPASLGQIQVTN